MNKGELIELINGLMLSNKPGEGDFTKVFKDQIEKCERLFDFQIVCSDLEAITKHYFSDPNVLQWKFIIYNIYVIQKIGDIEESNATETSFSVRESKIIKSFIAQLVKIGIYSKLLPKLPFSVQETYTETDDIFYQYNILKCTILALCSFLKNKYLRILVLPESLKGILTGLYQIAYCPLKKSPLTQRVYEKLLKEKDMSVSMLHHLKETIYPMMYVTETMKILPRNAPLWFAKAVSQTLTDILLNPRGLENIVSAMFHALDNDEAKMWTASDGIFRLISSQKGRLDFRENICRQLVDLVDKTNNDNDILVFERLFVFCVKQFYVDDEELTKNVFLRSVFIKLLRFTMKNYKFHDSDCTQVVVKSIRLLHAIFVEVQNLPINMLKPVLHVLFRIYCVTSENDFKETNCESKNLLLTYLKQHVNDVNAVFDSFLFSMCDSDNILPFRNDLLLESKEQRINIIYPEHGIVIGTAENAEKILCLLENNSKLLAKLFKYLLGCLMDKDKYLKRSNDTLLHLESEIINEYFERSLVVFNILSILAEKKEIQQEIIESPGEIIDYFKSVFNKAIEANIHLTEDFESEEFQTVFTVTMILNALVANYTKKTPTMFKVLVDVLTSIEFTTKHKELQQLVKNILNTIEASSKKINIEDIKSELDIILEDICDPLLPVRGHGLMALRKLVENKHESVTEKKQYILTIFQQNLKNNDSFIYLSAVDGLAAMANTFPDTVINTLCDEYSDCSVEQEKGHEVRVKLGEVLVRITKMLGDMAPKYKAVLLNTFLIGTRDADYLVRTSSLSNLGEICRVLSYKLGTVVIEVLVCVHGIIATDKVVDCRRAAVTVLRHLLAGLGSEMIVFLKEDILPIYRTLKQIYQDDKDDVMRLQAQLALEELNENMKGFVFPKQQINMDKKIIMLS